MAAFLVGHIKVKDDELWQRYMAGVRESLEPFDAEVMFRGALIAVLAGQHDYDLVVVIKFADQSELDSWYGSATYQSLISLRDNAADVVITAYND